MNSDQLIDATNKVFESVSRKHFLKRLGSPLLEPVDLQLHVLLLDLLHHTPPEGTRHLAKGITRKVNRLGSFREVSLPKSGSQRSTTGRNQTNLNSS
jgi:hypothetical protein